MLKAFAKVVLLQCVPLRYFIKNMTMAISFPCHHLRILLLSAAIFCCSHFSFSQDHQRCSCGQPLFCENFTIYTFHQIEDHPVFSHEMALDTGCANPEFFPTVKVVADGTQSTVLKIENLRCNCGTFDEGSPIILQQQDENGNPVGNSQPDDYGGFTFLSFSDKTSIFKYQHPKQLPDPGMTRRFFVHIYQNEPTDNYGGFWIEVFRPPVVFVHGLWSDESAFDKMYNALLNTGDYENYQLYKADYSTSNAASFDANNLVVRNAVTQVIDNCLYNGLSVGKVNIVAHSMGGLLSRQYLEALYYPSRHDVNRLITCNTPHEGSQMANFLLDTTQYGPEVSFVLGELGMDCYGGAVDNLRVNSPELNVIQLGTQPPDLHYHSVVTTAEPSTLFANFTTSMIHMHVQSLLLDFVVGQCGSSFIDDVFDHDESDGIVAAESQAGSLGGGQMTQVQDQVHIGSVANGMVIAKVRALLNAPFDSDKFASSYTPQFLSYSLDVPCLPLWNGHGITNDRGADSFSLHIDSPSSGTTVKGGDTLTVSYSASMLDSVVILMAFHPDSVALIANSASAGNVRFVVPANVLGHQQLIAIGFGSDKKIGATDSIDLNITTDATLTKLFFYPPVMYLDQQDSLPFTVNGMYSDGIRRNLTRDPALLFDFSLGNAVKTSNAFIRLDSPESDTLRVRVDSIVSIPVRIQKVISGNAPASYLCEDHLGTISCMDTIPSNASLVSPQLDTDAGNSCFYVCSNSVLNLTDNPNGPHGGNDVFVDQNGTVNISSNANNVVARAPSTVNLLPGSAGTTVVCMTGVSVFQNGIQIFPCTCDSVVFDYAFFDNACGTTGVNAVERAEKELNVFPVPSSSSVTITLDDGNTPMRHVYVLNVEGRIVMTLRGPRDTFSADVSSLTPGLYFIEAETDRGILFKKMLVE